MSSTPAPYVWMGWRSARDTQVWLIGLMHAIKHGTPPET
jgi:hypothetical protein